MLSESAATVRSKCHHIKYPDMLALVLYRSAHTICPWTGYAVVHLQCTSVKNLSVPSNEAVVGELGCAGYSLSAHDVL